MIQTKQDLDRVREYYTSRRSVGQGEESIYAIWEKGGAFHDSITPSTFVPEYRSHMVLKLLSLTHSGERVFSLGCGNAFVESDLAGLDRVVRAMDCNEEAVELARNKGVEAIAVDYFDLQPADIADADVIYADGFLGHLFEPEEEIGPALAKLKSLVPKPGSYLVFSNDAPQDRDAPYAPHERLPGFWFLSKDYLRESMEGSGFVSIENYYFPYMRPISGMRNRTICIARTP